MKIMRIFQRDYEYRETIDRAQTSFLNKNNKETLRSLSELIYIAAKNSDLIALGSAFLLKGMVELYFHDYPLACETLIEVVFFVNLI